MTPTRQPDEPPFWKIFFLVLAPPGAFFLYIFILTMLDKWDLIPG